MRTTILTTSVSVLTVSLLVGSLAFAKPAYKTALGAKACTDCHIAGKMKDPNPSNKLWKAAEEMEKKTKAGTGEFKGKTCNDCHKGKMVPEKKK